MMGYKSKPILLSHDVDHELDYLLDDLETMGMTVNRSALCSFAVHYFVDAAKAVINEGALRAAYNYSMYARSIQTMKRRRKNYVDGATNADR
jgi:hypothetical protein